ncbi:hypothetical protein T484DRAFT_1776002, partial [Baffinella frigidus]
MAELNSNGPIRISRPEPGDRALPMSYGDLCLFSCSFGREGVGYLCEEGCVVKGLAVDMKVSSRELVFEVCTAPDTRAQFLLDDFKRRHGIVGDDFGALPRQEELELTRRTHQRDMERKANEAQASNFVGRHVAYGDLIKVRHSKTKGLLGIDIGRAPKLEPSAKKIVLHTRDSDPVRFRITPRFKSLAEGNTVCYGDSIALVSVDYPTESLHASEGFSSTPIGVVHEVNLAHEDARTGTAWEPHCFFPYTMHNDQLVKLGDVVRLKHAVQDAYVSASADPQDKTISLVADGSCLSSTMWVIRDDN